MKTWAIKHPLFTTLVALSALLLIGVIILTAIGWRGQTESSFSIELGRFKVDFSTKQNGYHYVESPDGRGVVIEKTSAGAHIVPEDQVPVDLLADIDHSAALGVEINGLDDELVIAAASAEQEPSDTVIITYLGTGN
ncbi:MAG: hypothetical protein AAF485_26195 [Chloroflexota bacterium]